MEIQRTIMNISEKSWTPKTNQENQRKWLKSIRNKNTCEKYVGNYENHAKMWKNKENHENHEKY